MSTTIPFIDLAAQRQRLRPAVDDAIMRVLDHGRFIMGPEVAALEERLARRCGATHAVSCASGTDALLMILMAYGIGPGDAVIVPSFTFAASAEVVALLGATPVFAEIDDRTYTLDPDSIERCAEKARADGLRPRMVMPVDLFGQPADYDAVERLAADLDLLVLCDAAQSYGAMWRGRAVGSIGAITSTSFFPAKPLGCYGDGGAIFTDDDEIAGRLRSIRVHGKGTDKYDNVRIGINGRLDTIQAAVLDCKLDIFDDEIRRRQEVADRYSAFLRGIVTVPELRDGAISVWAQYVIRVGDRDGVAARLQERGVPTAIYYPRPLHAQTAFRDFPFDPAGLDLSERLADEVLALPLHPYLDVVTQERIATAVREAVGG